MAEKRKREITLKTTSPKRPTPAKRGQPRIFVSYCHRDQDACARLKVHMAQMEREGIRVWYDSEILPGGEIRKEISAALKKADIFVALVSADYLHSNYCYDIEYAFALRQLKLRKLRIVAVLVHSCEWRQTPMARYKLLPKDGKAVDQWKPLDNAYHDAVAGLRKVVAAVRKESSKKPVSNRNKKDHRTDPSKHTSSSTNKKPINTGSSPRQVKKPATGKTAPRTGRRSSLRPKTR